MRGCAQFGFGRIMMVTLCGGIDTDPSPMLRPGDFAASRRHKLVGLAVRGQFA